MAVINIQKDWDQVMTSQEPEKFWISLKREDQPTLHDYIYSDKTTSEDGAFVIKEHKDIYCNVSDTTTSFIAPHSTLSLSDNKISCMDISHSGELGVCSSLNGQLWIWDADTGESRRVLEGHLANVDTCKFFPSGVVVLSGACDFMLKIWSAIDGKCARTLIGHTRSINDTCIIERGRNVISVSDDGTSRLWDCGSSQCLSVIADISSPINSCDIKSIPSLVNPPHTEPLKNEHGTDSKVLLIVSDDGFLRIYDVRNCSKINEYYCHSSTQLTKGVFIGNDKVITGDDTGKVSLFDLRQMKAPILEGPSVIKSPVTSLLAYNDNQTVIGFKDGSCVVWNYKDEISSSIRLTGFDIDPVTQIVTCHTNLVYTSSRDGCVRMYRI